ncbi:unnamed protein product [Ixodes persulcatus]
MTIHNFTLHLTPIPRLLTKIYEVLRLSSKGAYATAVRSTYTLILGQRCELGFLTNGTVCATVLSSIAFFQSERRHASSQYLHGSMQLPLRKTLDENRECCLHVVTQKKKDK